MKTMKMMMTLIAVAGLVLALAQGASADMITVTVGNPGNTADDTGYGAVAYNYSIGKYEVTWTQYAEFLNAVAATDTYALYNTNMGSDATHGGITRTGSSGSYIYTVKSGFENRPVAYVSWYDSIRFANWMTGGATENGSYTITDGGPNSGTVTIPDASQRATWSAGSSTYWLLPSEDEWYKAAYYDPNKSGGAGYWDYPNTSDVIPTATTVANQLSSAPGSANYGRAVGKTTDVGAYTDMPTDSAYGTYDQAGNVWEWTEARIIRSGAFGDGASYLAASSRYYWTSEVERVGFRVASVGTVPAGTLFIFK